MLNFTRLTLASLYSTIIPTTLKQIAIILACLSLPTAASADSFFHKLFHGQPGQMPYNFIKLNYLDYDDFGDGYNFQVSFLVQPKVALQGTYQTASEGPIDLTIFGIDGVFHTNFYDLATVDFFRNTDLELRAGYKNVKAEIDGFTFSTPVLNGFGIITGSPSASTSDSGLSIGAQLRKQQTAQLELFTKASLDLATASGFGNSSSSDLKIGAGVAFEFIPHLNAIAEFTLADQNTLELGLRYNLP